MRVMKIGYWVLPLALAAPTLAQDDGAKSVAATPVVADDDALADEYDDLMDAYQEAYAEWLRPYREAKTDEERASALDFDAQPAKDFVPKFQAFEEKATGTEWGAQALMWVYSYGSQADANIPKKAVGKLIDVYIGSKHIEPLAVQLRYGASSLGEDKTKEALYTLLEASPHRTVKAAAQFSLAAMQMGRGDGEVPEEVRMMLEELIERYADTPYAEQAERQLFQLDNLQIGKFAPDFASIDQDGVKFKLSDYKGKVVVLDFWGMW